MSVSRFAKGKDFSASALRYWANRLGATPPPTPASPARPGLARVLRVPPKGGERPASEQRSLLELEMAGARVRIGTGFDRKTLVDLLDVLEERGGRGVPR